MNHTQKNEHIEMQGNCIQKAYREINSLRKYLNSKKFHCGDRLDGYVNVSDIHDRLDIVVSKLMEA